MWVSRLMLACLRARAHTRNHSRKRSPIYIANSVSRYLRVSNACQMVNNLHRTYTEHRTISILRYMIS